MRTYVATSDGIYTDAAIRTSSGRHIQLSAGREVYSHVQLQLCNPVQ
ncbi:hypothetical protein HZP56_10920 [Elizabethkingia anophelis]|nr:hypothetical protein [Elizabethkingia anophelis]MCT4177344.1 hypothetical protein [Elizabethkingia anophelis]